jgi:hypothetical protein
MRMRNSHKEIFTVHMSHVSLDLLLFLVSNALTRITSFATLRHISSSSKSMLYNMQLSLKTKTQWRVCSGYRGCGGLVPTLATIQKLSVSHRLSELDTSFAKELICLTELNVHERSHYDPETALQIVLKLPNPRSLLRLDCMLINSNACRATFISVICIMLGDTLRELRINITSVGELCSLKKHASALLALTALELECQPDEDMIKCIESIPKLTRLEFRGAIPEWWFNYFPPLPPNIFPSGLAERLVNLVCTSVPPGIMDLRDFTSLASLTLYGKISQVLLSSRAPLNEVYLDGIDLPTLTTMKSGGNKACLSVNGLKIIL